MLSVPPWEAPKTIKRAMAGLAPGSVSVVIYAVAVSFSLVSPRSLVHYTSSYQ